MSYWQFLLTQLLAGKVSGKRRFTCQKLYSRLKGRPFRDLTAEQVITYCQASYDEKHEQYHIREKQADNHTDGNKQQSKSTDTFHRIPSFPLTLIITYAGNPQLLPESPALS